MVVKIISLKNNDENTTNNVKLKCLTRDGKYLFLTFFGISNILNYLKNLLRAYYNEIFRLVHLAILYTIGSIFVLISIFKQTSLYIKSADILLCL